MIDGIPKNIDTSYKKKQIKNVLFNMFFSTSFVIAFYLTFIIPPNTLFKPIYLEFLEGFIDLVFGELWFGFVHYTFHKIPYLFKTIHKKHHEIIITQGWHSLYAHPLDVILTNIGSMIITHYIFNHSIIFCLLIGSLAVFNTIIGAHTNKTPNGYHQMHHKNWNINFGFGMFSDNKGFLFDRLMNTYNKKIE